MGEEADQKREELDEHQKYEKVMAVVDKVSEQIRSCQKASCQLLIQNSCGSVLSGSFA